MNIMLSYKANIIYTIIKLAKSKNANYIMDKDSAKELTKTLLKVMSKFDFTNSDYEKYIEDVNEVIENLK